MKRAIITTAICIASSVAFAADIPSKKPAPAPVGVNWSGFYSGFQVGVIDGSSKHFYGPTYGSSLGISGNSKPNGTLIGFFGGYNIQKGQVVFGVEADINGTDTSGSYSKTWLNQGTSHSNWNGSVRARAGVAVNRALIYATGGITNATWKIAGNPLYGQFNKNMTGFTIGGGIEYSITDKMAIRAEYRYSDYGKYKGILAYSIGKHGNINTNTALLGISYRF